MALGNCPDSAIKPGTIYTGPGVGTSWTGFAIGRTFKLSCTYYDNIAENRWYAETSPVYGAGKNQYGYVWVQALNYGSRHSCYWAGYEELPIAENSIYCPLIPLNEAIAPQ